MPPPDDDSPPTPARVVRPAAARRDGAHGRPAPQTPLAWLRTLPALVQALAAAAVLFGAVAAIGLVVAAVALTAPQGGQVGPAAVGAARAMSRAEFEAAVMGKTRDEVLAAVGKPSRTDTRMEDNPQYPSDWTYYKRVADPVTGDVKGVSIQFGRDGRVENINF